MPKCINKWKEISQHFAEFAYQCFVPEENSIRKFFFAKIEPF